MKPYLLAVAWGLISVTLPAQATKKQPLMQPSDLSARLQAVEDRLALKELVDTFSVLADKKDTPAQTLLFTEDAVLDSYVGGQRVSSLRGRQQIGEAFAAYLAGFTTVYHHNGQQTVSLHGDQATGVAYCYVTLVGEQNGQKINHVSGVVYQDEYRRVNGHWLIARRTSQFGWQEQHPIQ